MRIQFMENGKEHCLVCASWVLIGRMSFAKAGLSRRESCVAYPCCNDQKWWSLKQLLGTTTKISKQFSLLIIELHFPSLFSGCSHMPAQATPQRNTSLPHLGRAFTDIQEKKQVARLKKVITNFWHCRSYSYVLTVHLENKTWKPS